MFFKRKPYDETKDPLFQVRQSPSKKGAETLKEFLVQAPQYLLAFLIYIDICILYYLVLKTGGLLLAFTTAYGLYARAYNSFQLVCLFFTGHCLGNLIFLRIFFNNEKRLRWFYDHVGVSRAKPKLFASPLITALSRATLPAVVGIVAVEAGTTVQDAIVFQAEKKFEVDEAIKVYNEAKATALEQLTDKLDTSKRNSQFQKAAYRFYEQELQASKVRHDEILRRVGARTHTPVGIVTRGLTSETATETAKTVGGVFTSIFGNRR